MWSATVTTIWPDCRSFPNAHDGLYKTSEPGWPTLVICNGESDLTSVNTQAFGTGFELDLSVFSEIPLTEG